MMWSVQAALRAGGDASKMEVLHRLRQRQPGNGRRVAVRQQIL